MKYQELVNAVAKLDIKYPHLAAAMLSQCILESGRCDTDLAKLHNNAAGMKFRKEMESICEGVEYKTNSEPTGSAVFCKFKDAESFVHGYWHFLSRSPYKGWENHINNAEDFLSFICPIWCSKGYTFDWKNKHGGMNYHKYILNNLYNEAVATLEKARKKDPEPLPTPINKTIMLNVGHHGTEGASGANKAIKEREANQLVVDTCKAILANNGVKTDEVDQDTHGGLSGVGKAAANYDVSIAVHHNAYNGKAQGVLWLGGKNKPESVKFGKYWSAQVAKKFNIENRGQSDMTVTVTNEFDKTKCPVAILIECSFIDVETNLEDFKKRCVIQGEILADCILKYCRGEL